MSNFVDKIKQLLSEELSTSDSNAINKGGLTNNFTINRGSYGSGDNMSPESARGIVSSNTKRMLYTMNEKPEKTDEADPNWKPDVYEFTFPEIERITDQSANMVLTKQTGIFLSNLFSSIFHDIKTTDVKFTILPGNKTASQDIADITSNVGGDFQRYCNKFVNFLKNDGRLYPDSYIVSIVVPIKSYNPEDINTILQKFNIPMDNNGIADNEIPDKITIQFNIDCRTTLLNVYNNNNFFRVGTNRSSLEKYSWMTKKMKDIYKINTTAAKEKSKSDRPKTDAFGEVEDKEYITPRTLNSSKVSYNIKELLSDLYSWYGFGDNEIFCFLDETDTSYIYIPGTEQTKEKYFVIDTRSENDDIGSINTAIKRFIEGLMSKDEFIKECKDKMGSEGFKTDVMYSNIDDNINAILSKCFDGEQLIVDATSDNYDDVLVKPIKHLVDTLPEEDRDRYKFILDTIESPEKKAAIITNYSEKDSNSDYRNAVEDLKTTIENYLNSDVTTSSAINQVIKLLTDFYSNIHVFRFMYSDQVSISYMMSLPSKTASEALKKYGIDPSNVKGTGVIPLDNIAVPGSENLPRLDTKLVRSTNIDADTNTVGGLSYTLVTTSNDVARTPAGSMYGIRYENSLVPPEYRSASYVFNIFEMRNLLGKIIDMYYFEPTQNQIQDLLNGNKISVDNIVYYPDSASVKTALDTLDKSGKTLIKRIRPKRIVNQDYEVIINNGETVHLSNEKTAEMIFSDYYDAIVNIRQQIERYMEKHGMLSNEDKFTGKTSQFLRESGKPTMVERITDDIVNGIKSSEDHEISYNKAVSDVLIPNNIGAAIGAFISYLKAKNDKPLPKKFSATLPKVELSNWTDEKQINFSGDRIFVNKNRNAWLNGESGPIIPFFESFVNGTLYDDLSGHFKLIQTTQDAIKSFYSKIIDLYEITKNFEKLQISDGCRTRMYSKKVKAKGVASKSEIDTGLSIYLFDSEKLPTDEKTALNELLDDATAQDINSGIIMSDFIKTKFSPVAHIIRETISAFRADGNYPLAIADTPTNSVVPLCPYNTAVFAVNKDNKIVLYIISSVVMVRNIPTDEENKVKYDSKNKVFDFPPEFLDGVDDQSKEKILEKMAKKDAVYCMANLFSKNYAEEYIKSTFAQYKEKSVDLFNLIRSRIEEYSNEFFDLDPNLRTNEIEYVKNNIKENDVMTDIMKKFTKTLSSSEDILNGMKNLAVYINMIDIATNAEKEV